MLYTYAFFQTPPRTVEDQLQSVQGLAGSVQVVNPPQCTVAAAVESIADLNDWQSSDERLLRSALRHDQVICQLFAYTEVLPLRFGTCFLSSEKLQEHLLSRQQDYQQALKTLMGRAEYLLKGYSQVMPPRVVSAQSGTAYLLARKQHFLEQQHAQEQQKLEIDALDALWPLVWPRAVTDPQGEERLRRYFLLSPQQQEEAVARMGAWLKAHPHWQLEWSTPLPPYHFVQLSLPTSKSLSEEP